MGTTKYTYPPGYTVITSIPRMFKQVKDPVGTMEESMELFNGTYSVHLGATKYIVTQDPGLIEHVLKSNHRNYYKSPLQTDRLGKFLGNGLLTSNGEYWLKQRRLIQPGFHVEKINALYGIIQKTVDEFLLKFPEGKQNIFPMMNSLAFEIVINTLFNITIPQNTRQLISEFINEAQAFIMKDIRQPYKSWWFKISGEEKQNLDRAQRTRKIISDIIQERKRSGDRRNDLLDMLLDARYETTGEPMEEYQIIDEIMVLIIAGHDTTANALSWTLYLLATHPEQIKKLKDATKGLAIKETVTNPILNSVIKESMRLYPPAWISDRVALNDDSYGDLKFPKDTIILLFYYGLHRDSKFWDDPDAFKPERFSVGNADKEKSKYYFPFGSGPRLCIGNNFAMAEMAIFLQSFVEQFSIEPTDVKPKLNPLVTLKPDQVTLQISREK
jgi:cytochrome P450